MTKWFNETLYTGFRQSHEIKKVLFEGKSKYQKVTVFESARYGRILGLDGVVQCTEGDEFVYHEMLTHLPMLAHGKVRDVLIIGGGDGGILEEVLKHKSVRRATMVEIDDVVIDVSKKYLSSICGKAFQDKRTNLIVGDGAAWVRETEERYDLIIVDRPDPVGPATVLFSGEFYKNCKRVMKPGAILVLGWPRPRDPGLPEALRRRGGVACRAQRHAPPAPHGAAREGRLLGCRDQARAGTRPTGFSRLDAQGRD